jgi:WD40 repeat protein
MFSDDDFPPLGAKPLQKSRAQPQQKSCAHSASSNSKGHILKDFDEDLTLLSTLSIDDNANRSAMWKKRQETASISQLELDHSTGGTKPTAAGGGAAAVAAVFECMIDRPERLRDSKIINRVSNVHEDDVHFLFALSDSFIVSGSKDGFVKCWKPQTEAGILLHQQFDCKDPQRGVAYEQWASSGAAFSDQHGFCVAFRDGRVRFWDIHHKVLQESRHLAFSENQEGGIRKERNKNRVNCVLPWSNNCVMLGKAKSFSGWSLSQFEERQLFDVHVDSNDWTYCLQPVPGRLSSCFVVSGSNLSIFSSNPENIRDWNLSSRIIKEDKGLRKHQRPFISCIETVPELPHVVCGCFDSCIRLADYEKCVTIRELRLPVQPGFERVWSTSCLPHVSASVFLTSHEDGRICLWDARVQNALQYSRRISNDRVSCALKSESPNVFMFASCSSDRRSLSKAVFSFCDVSP